MVSDNFTLTYYDIDMLKIKIPRNPTSPTILALKRVENQRKVGNLGIAVNLAKVRSLERAANLVKAECLKKAANPVKVRTRMNRMKAEKQRFQKEIRYHKNRVVGTSIITNHKQGFITGFL